MTVKQSKRQKLERTGWRVGTASDFVGLSAEESAQHRDETCVERGIARRA